MKQVITAFVAMTWLLIFLSEQGRAQVPNTVAVGFSNNSNTPVIVKGYTIVNATKRPGQLMPMKKGGKSYEDNVPVGVRFYTVWDAVTNRVLLADHPVPIQGNTFLNVATNPLDPTKVLIINIK